MRADGVLGDPELARDAPARRAGGDQFQDLKFPWRQRGAGRAPRVPLGITDRGRDVSVPSRNTSVGKATDRTNELSDRCVFRDAVKAGAGNPDHGRSIDVRSDEEDPRGPAGSNDRLSTSYIGSARSIDPEDHHVRPSATHVVQEVRARRRDRADLDPFRNENDLEGLGQQPLVVDDEDTYVGGPRLRWRRGNAPLSRTRRSLDGHPQGDLSRPKGVTDDVPTYAIGERGECHPLFDRCDVRSPTIADVVARWRDAVAR